jgi:hypothetical protein
LGWSDWLKPFWKQLRLLENYFGNLFINLKKVSEVSKIIYKSTNLLAAFGNHVLGDGFFNKYKL